MTVYGWNGYRDKVGPTREIMAAPSTALVLRAAYVRTRHQLGDFGESTTPEELAAAEGRPGVILWRPRATPDAEWRRG